MSDIEGLAVHRRCVERIEGAWSRFLAHRQELLAQDERFGSAPETLTGGIIAWNWGLADGRRISRAGIQVVPER